MDDQLIQEVSLVLESLEGGTSVIAKMVSKS